MHVGGRGLRAGVAHQLLQHQQVDTSLSQLGPVGMAQPVRPDAGRPGPVPMEPEDPAHPGLGHGPASGGPAEHHEALRGGTSRGSLGTQISGELGEEGPIERDHAFPAALADHPDPPQPHVHVGQAQRADLASPQAAQDHGQGHGAVAMGPQIGQERLDVPAVQALGQPPELADQPTARSRSSGPEVAEQAPLWRSQTRGMPGCRDRVRGPLADHGQELEQAADRGDAAVHRGGGAAPGIGETHDGALGHGSGASLPVDVVEQIARLDVDQGQPADAEEPAEVQQVIRIGANRGRGEGSSPEVLEEPVDQVHVRVGAPEPMLVSILHDRDIHDVLSYPVEGSASDPHANPERSSCHLLCHNANKLAYPWPEGRLTDNVIDRLPKRLQPEARARIAGIWGSLTRSDAERARDATVAWLRGRGQADAATTLLRDWDDLVTFYDLPAEHWRHLRTSNVIESVFAGVRLRTTVAKRAPNRENALYLVYKIVQRLAGSWRQLNGGATLMTLLLTGAKFQDGILVEHPARRQPEVPMAA